MELTKVDCDPEPGQGCCCHAKGGCPAHDAHRPDTEANNYIRHNLTGHNPTQQHLFVPQAG